MDWQCLEIALLRWRFERKPHQPNIFWKLNSYRMQSYLWNFIKSYCRSVIKRNIEATNDQVEPAWLFYMKGLVGGINIILLKFRLLHFPDIFLKPCLVKPKRGNLQVYMDLHLRLTLSLWKFRNRVCSQSSQFVQPIKKFSHFSWKSIYHDTLSL